MHSLPLELVEDDDSLERALLEQSFLSELLDGDDDLEGVLLEQSLPPELVEGDDSLERALLEDAPPCAHDLPQCGTPDAALMDGFFNELLWSDGGLEGLEVSEGPSAWRGGGGCVWRWPRWSVHLEGRACHAAHHRLPTEPRSHAHLTVLLPPDAS